MGGGGIFSPGSFPKGGQKQKTEKKEKKKAKVGDNNGQATHGARKHAWRTQAAWAKKKSRVSRQDKCKSFKGHPDRLN